MHSIHDTDSNNYRVIPEQLEPNYAEGLHILVAIEAGELTGVDLRTRVRDFLVANAQVVGSPKISVARLNLYQTLDGLSDYEVAEQLSRLIDDAVNFGRRLTETDNEAASALGRMMP